MKIPIPILIPDTNYLMDFPDVYNEKWRITPVRILTCETVESELRGLARNEDMETREKAQRALKLLAQYRGGAFAWDQFNQNMSGEEQEKVFIEYVERYTDEIPPLDPTNNDHQIIALAQKLTGENRERFCAILSNDNELRDIAHVRNLIAISRHSDARFHQELETMYFWKQKDVEAAARAKQLRTKRRTRASQAGVAFERYNAKLYRQIKALNFRTTIFLPPLKARIRLAVEVAQRIRNPDSRIVMIFLKDQETEQYWAGEIRQMGGFSGNEAIVFGDASKERLDKARVIFYQHKQICPHLPQHIARLTKLKKKVTAIVDGCDILEPVELAILLYECGQFVGLNYLPWNDGEARGRKMLETVLYNRSLPDYSFTDAERDGWGHACEFDQIPVEFEPQEKLEWDKTNHRFIQIHERVAAGIGSYENEEDFWQKVNWALARSVDPAAAELVRLREEREQWAQCAHNKLKELKNLLTAPHEQTRRQIILDFGRQWSQVLMRHLEGCDIKLAELPEGVEEQRRVWDQFAGNRYDTLILTKAPPPDFPQAPFQRLIILTPLQPLEEMVEVIDWSLAHTSIPDALWTHLLYVNGTPEWLAMMDLAKVGFR